MCDILNPNSETGKVEKMIDFQNVTLLSKRMERDDLDLALANILDVIPWIDNCGDDVDELLNQTLVRIYERNLAALNR